MAAGWLGAGAVGGGAGKRQFCSSGLASQLWVAAGNKQELGKYEA